MMPRQNRRAVIGQFVTAGGVAEQELAEEKFRLAVEGCPIGMVMADHAGKIMLVNTGTERMFGYPREELVGQLVDILVPLRLRTQHVRHRDNFVADPETRRMGSGRDLFGLRKDGTEFPVEVGLNAIHVGEERLILSVIADISTRKHSERLKDEFVATASHEMRTPLTSIAASLGLLAGTAAAELPDNILRLITIAHANSQRLIRLINDILDIEKMESDKFFFILQRVEIRSLVEQAIEANRAFAEGCGVKLRLDDASIVMDVRTDTDRLTQVITNLLSNAVKFSPPGAEVLLAVEACDAGVRITVRDHGSGIPADFRSRIFDKFAQADATVSRQKSGTGLGLSIVKQIVTRLGGKVAFADAPGGGTIFTVEIPTLIPIGDENADADGETDGRILLCADDADAALALRERLREADFTIDIAQTARAAVARAASTAYAAVLVDLQLSDGDGISLIQELRALPQHSDTPTIVISAYPGRGRDDLRSPNLNVLDWLAKPLDVTHLLKTLHRSIPSTPAARLCILHVNDDAAILAIVAQALASSIDVVSVATIDDARCALAANRFDLALIDLALDRGSSMDLLPELHDNAGDAIPVIVYSAEGANSICAAQVKAALTKSRSSVDSLIATLRKRLAPNLRHAARESAPA